MDVSFTKKFIKQFRKLPNQGQQQFHDRLELFLNDQQHLLLRRHALKGNMPVITALIYRVICEPCSDTNQVIR